MGTLTNPRTPDRMDALSPHPKMLIACHDCDLLHEVDELEEGSKAVCIRCGAIIAQRPRNSIDRSLALAATGLILFILANLFPFLSLNAQGQIKESTLISSSIALLNWEAPVLGVFVFFTTIVFPFVEILGILYLMLPLKYGQQPARHATFIARFILSTQPWGMLEIFMLAVLVAIVKLGDIATVVPGISLYAFTALIFVLTGLSITLDLHEFWNRMAIET